MSDKRSSARHPRTRDRGDVTIDLYQFIAQRRPVKRKERLNDAIRLKDDDDAVEAYNASHTSADVWDVRALLNLPSSTTTPPVKIEDVGRYSIQVRRIMNIAPAVSMSKVPPAVSPPGEVGVIDIR